jgi:hypothetical protein
MNLIYKWHSYLNMPKYDIDWHKNDIKDELEELKEAEGFIDKWSEISDVVYTYTRAEWSGHKELVFPLKKINFYVGLVYMFPKYTLRWKFFNKLGKKFDKDLNITEVRNPKKIHKLEDIAKRYNIDSVIFINVAQRMMKWWVFFK